MIIKYLSSLDSNDSFALLLDSTSDQNLGDNNSAREVSILSLNNQNINNDASQRPHQSELSYQHSSETSEELVENLELTNQSNNNLNINNTVTISSILNQTNADAEMVINQSSISEHDNSIIQGPTRTIRSRHIMSPSLLPRRQLNIFEQFRQLGSIVNSRQTERQSERQSEHAMNINSFYRYFTDDIPLISPRNLISDPSSSLFFSIPQPGLQIPEYEIIESDEKLIYKSKIDYKFVGLHRRIYGKLAVNAYDKLVKYNLIRCPSMNEFSIKKIFLTYFHNFEIEKKVFDRIVKILEIKAKFQINKKIHEMYFKFEELGKIYFSDRLYSPSE